MGTPVKRNLYGIKYYADTSVSGGGANGLLPCTVPGQMETAADCKPDFLCKCILEDAAFGGCIRLLVMVCRKEA